MCEIRSTINQICNTNEGETTGTVGLIGRKSDLMRDGRRRWRALRHGSRLRGRLWHPRESFQLHPSQFAVEKRVCVECLSQAQGTSGAHTTQEFVSRVCTRGSGTSPARRNSLFNSTGSGVVARGGGSRPVVALPSLRRPQKPLVLRTRIANHLPKKRALRSSGCFYPPCNLVQCIESKVESQASSKCRK